MYILSAVNVLPVRLFVCSEVDAASMNIRQKLLSLADWREEEPFEGRPSYSLKDVRMVTIGQEHLYRDDVDRDAEALFGERPQVVTYLSCHRSESERRSLTIHPIGNHRQADFGGKPSTLVTSAPREMTGALRALHEVAKGVGYAVSFEATHHGPFLRAPTFIIEAGSDIGAWSDPLAGEKLAMALLRARTAGGAVGIGVGGGHYMPRVTDVALSRDVCFGHMIPSYALSEMDEGVLERALEQTPGVGFVYFHRKALAKPLLRRMEEWFVGRGIRVVREEDLPALEGVGP